MRNFAIVISLTASLLAAGCGRREVRAFAAREPAPVEVPTISVSTQPFHSSRPFTGTLVSRSRVEVKAETTGRIVRFDKQEGDPVRAGEPIAWVNDENYQLALRQAETAVRAAEAARDRAGVLESHSAAELARAANLLQSGGITEKDLKAAQLAGRDAKAQTAVANAQLEQALAAVAVARKRLAETAIRAPIAGEIQNKLVNVGGYVEPATPILTIVDNSRLEIESPISAADLGAVKTGQRVSFRVSSYPDASFAGEVAEISPAMDEQTRSAKGRIRVPWCGGRLKTGMFAQGEIYTGEKNAAIVISAAALYRDDRSVHSGFVFVIEKNKAVRRAVVLGTERDSLVEVVEGLRPGDQLISEQSIEIAEGVRVKARG